MQTALVIDTLGSTALLSLSLFLEVGGLVGEHCASATTCDDYFLGMTLLGKGRPWLDRFLNSLYF